jgi:hypothetical protein
LYTEQLPPKEGKLGMSESGNTTQKYEDSAWSFVLRGLHYPVLQQLSNSTHFLCTKQRWKSANVLRRLVAVQPCSRYKLFDEATERRPESSEGGKAPDREPLKSISSWPSC